MSNRLDVYSLASPYEFYGTSCPEDGDVQEYLDAHGYEPGSRYTDQEAIDAVGPHVTSIDGLSGGTVSGDVVVEGDLTVTGNANLASVNGGFTRRDESLDTEFQSTSDSGEVVHSYTFSTQPDPLATAFVIDADMLYTNATCSGNARVTYTLEGWVLATFSLSWGMAPEDPPDTWITKHGTFTNTLPLTGESHSIDVELRVSAGCGAPQVKLRNQSLRWHVAG